MNEHEARGAAVGERIRLALGEQQAMLESLVREAAERLLAPAVAEAEEREASARACLAQKRGGDTVFRPDDDACDRCALAIRARAD